MGKGIGRNGAILGAGTGRTGWRRALVLSLLVLALVASNGPASAQSWRERGMISGFFAGGTPNGLYLRCAGGDVAVNFSGFGARLPERRSYRVGVSVDGTARLLSATAFEVSGRTVLVHRAPLDALRPLIADLRKGRKAEITTPAGRYEVPLTGSGAALGSLLARCE